MCFSKPSAPPPPPPPKEPPDPPKKSDESVKRRREESRKAAMSLAGDKSTILTSATGLLESENRGKTLLGG